MCTAIAITSISSTITLTLIECRLKLFSNHYHRATIDCCKDGRPRHPVSRSLRLRAKDSTPNSLSPPATASSSPAVPAHSLHPNARQAYLSDWPSSRLAPPSLTASQNSGEAVTSAACGAMRRVRFVLRQGWSWAVRCHVLYALCLWSWVLDGWVWAVDGRARVRRLRTSILHVYSTSLSHQASLAFSRLQTRDSSHFPCPTPTPRTPDK